jgi:hypothetical protein
LARKDFLRRVDIFAQPDMIRITDKEGRMAKQVQAKVNDHMILSMQIIESTWYMHCDLHECGGVTIKHYYRDLDPGGEVTGQLIKTDEEHGRIVVRVHWRRDNELNAARISRVLNPQFIFSYGER